LRDRSILKISIAECEILLHISFHRTATADLR